MQKALLYLLSTVYDAVTLNFELYAWLNINFSVFPANVCSYICSSGTYHSIYY